MIEDKGPEIGTYRGRGIPAFIVSGGRRFDYDRIAIEKDGGVELSQLRRDERVIAPGLIYREVATAP